MNPHRHHVSVAVEDSAATFTNRTWTALSCRWPTDRLPGAVIQRHHTLRQQHPDAYLPLNVYGYCMMIAARTAGGCHGHSLAYVTAATAKPRQLQRLITATTSQEAAHTAITLLKPKTIGLCIARLWSDLTKLDADRTPLGFDGQTIADRIRNQWHIDIHRNQS